MKFPAYFKLCVFLVVASFAINVAVAEDKVDPTGTWTWVRELEGQTNRSVLKLSYKEGNLTGTYKRMGQIVPITKGKLDKDKISFETSGTFADRKINAKFQGRVKKDAIDGNIELTVDENSIPLNWTAKRGVDVDDLVGTWKLKVERPNGEPIEPTLKLALDGENLKGTYTSRFGEREAKELKVDGSTITWIISGERNGQKYKLVYKGTPDGKAIKGSVDYELGDNSGTLDFTGAKDAAKNEPKKDASPKSSAKPAAGGPVNVQATDKLRVIVMLKSRNETVTVYSTDHGPAFTVISIDGKLIAKEISLQQLQASYPKYYEMFRTSYASLWADSAMRPQKSPPRERNVRDANILYHGVDFER